MSTLKSKSFLLILSFWVVVGCGSSDDGSGASSEGQGWSADGAGTAFPDAAFPDAVLSGDTSALDDAGPSDDESPQDGEGGEGEALDASIPQDAAPDGSELPGDATAPEETAAPDGASTRQPPAPAEILVDPETYQFSYVSPLAQALTKQIAIYNAGGSLLTVTAIAMDPASSPDFSLVGVPPMPRKLGPGEHALAIVRFQDVQGGTGTLRISSTDPERPVVDVVLTSHIKASLPQPCVGLVPASLNFGAVVRGTTKTLGATVKNCSQTTPLTLQKIARASSLFGPLTDEMQLAPEPASPVVLQPGDSYPVEVTYAPLLAGPDFGSFIAYTDDPDEPQAKLDVSGIGLAPPPEELGLSIKLSWDSDLTDVDSHLLTPGGTLFDCTTDCYFSNPAPDWGVAGDWVDDPFLDLDDVDGYGPEHINASDLQPGTYTYIAHYWDDTHEGSFPHDANVTVQVYSFGTKLAEFGPVHLPSTNWTWDVFTIAWPSKVITPLGALYSASGSAACFGGFWP